MSVKTYDVVPDGKTVEEKPTIHRLDSSTAGIAGIAFGAPLWTIGALYTLRGWTLGVNLLFAIWKLPTWFRLPSPADFWVLLFIPVGLIYSIVEVRYRPWRLHKLLWQVALIYLLIVATDLGSTLVTTLYPEPGAWDITMWASKTPWAAGLWTVFLTFIPEVLIVGGWRLLRR